ncbi:unnamed protein product, partial [Brassica oleracea]
ITGLPLHATVADGVRNGDWWVNASRSRNPLISMLKQCLPSIGETFQAESDDRYESREHLFFNCMYSSTIWNHFLTRANLKAPNTFDSIVMWMARPSSDPHVTLIFRLLYQALMYAIWRERNARLHSPVQRTSDTLITEIKDTIRLRIDPLSRSTRLNSSSASSLTPLGTWFSLF